jgi:DNA adenine methylase
MSKTVTRPILRFHGGKFRLAPFIISYMPEHRVYTEAYGGAASVLLRKPRSYAEVYNDLDGEIVNLFRQVRDNGQELKRLLALTPFAREEYMLAWLETDDPMEQARRTVIRSFMGFGSAAATMGTRRGKPRIDGKAGTGFRGNSNRSGTTPAHDWKNFAGTGFRYTHGDGKKTKATTFANFEDCLTPIIERLRGVVIENKDALEVIAAHDGEKTLHYVDPPYPAETRDAGSDYQHEMTTEQHRALSVLLHDVEGAVILSGYACDLYDKELYVGWHRVEKAAMADGALKRTEVLWMNHKCIAGRGGLFE